VKSIQGWEFVCVRKKFLSSIFINFLSHLQKNRASRDSYFVCLGGRSAVKNLKRLGRHCPRKRYQQIVGNVCAYCRGGFWKIHCPTRRNEIKKQKLQLNASPRHAICILLPTVCFVRHLNVDRFRVDPKYCLRSELSKIIKETLSEVESKFKLLSAWWNLSKVENLSA